MRHPLFARALFLGAVVVMLAPVPSRADELLQNGGFDGGSDAQGVPDHWSMAVYGAQPVLSLDEPAPGLAGHSLRVESDVESDTAIYQDIRVRPSGWYRLSGWVRTRDLVGSTAIYGALCACRGPAPFRHSPNRSGTSGWRREEITFRAPETGWLRVAAFFVGFGKGTGTVWFDDLRLEPIEVTDLASERIIVTSERLSAEPISPSIYGNFIEFLDHHVQGMRAQMLDDVSFEGIIPPADWCFLQRDKDVDDHPWHDTGYGGDGKVEVVSEGAFNGTRCYRIQSATPADSGYGIRQGGVSVRARMKYTLSLYLRGDGLSGPVRVSVGKDFGAFVTAYAEGRVDDVSSEWSKHTVALEPDTTDRDAELSVRLDGTGTLYIDQVTLMPEDHVLGWREDVVRAVRELEPHCLRFGGSTVIAYDWRKGIGDPDRRVPFENWPWGRMEPNDVGMDEFLQFCELVGAEPLVCASFNTQTPEDAAAQVQYCNGGADTEWGQVRARNGRSKPYGVRLWQVGNEQQGEDYESKLAAFCRAMKAADPSIEILSSFPTDGVLQRAGEWIDYLSPHHYTPSLSAIVEDIAAQRDRVARLGQGRRIRLAVTEWNHTAGDMGPGRALLATQYNALFCARVLHIYQRNSDLVAIANRSNLTNSWCAGVIQTTRDALYVTPAYYTMQLLSTRCGTSPLRVTDDGGGEVDGPEFGSVLDVAATLGDEGKTLSVSVVNDGPDPVTTTLDLSAHIRRATRGHLATLAAKGPHGANDAATPDRVHPVEDEVHVPPRFEHRFPAWSLTVLTVERDVFRPQ